MIKNKIIDYLELMKTKEAFSDSMIRTFNATGIAPEGAWIEFFTDLDYSLFINRAAEIMCNYFTEIEIDELLKFAKGDVFQKYLKVHSILQLELQTDSSSLWLKSISKNELLRLEAILKKYNVEENIIDAVLKTFTLSENDIIKKDLMN
jgi:hypothetical protein